MIGLSEETLRRVKQRLEGGEGVSLDRIHNRGNSQSKRSVCAHIHVCLMYLRIGKEANVIGAE